MDQAGILLVDGLLLLILGLCVVYFYTRVF